MTMGSTRRTVLATGAAGTAALLVGCGEYGGDSDSGSGSDSDTVEEASPGDTGTGGGEELARTADIPVGGGKIFKDQKVVVTQPEEGDFKAFSAVCTHQGCIVASVSDKTINCACHGSKFEIADGAVANGPATRPLPAEEITVSGNSIQLA
ncbi:Rieske (2Fe-2S) protein [Streptomyces adelaidensis]|uniref:Rieske (2Fe-2S) protein n=1 Tax=Streptomyces adelaidensis TaxID=2796465 RepID=UPI0019032EAC|nr:Rieske (2Fe-2S) protein [Streptomyces adelaidensis]